MAKLWLLALTVGLCFILEIVSGTGTKRYISDECLVNVDGHGECIDKCNKLEGRPTGCCYPNNPVGNQDNQPGKCICCQITDVCIPWNDKGEYGGPCSSACFYADGSGNCPGRKMI